MRIAALTLAAGLVAIAGCSGTESVQQARGKVDVFHRHLDHANYEAIWAASSDDIKGGDKARFIALLAAVHGKLGKVRETTQTGWRANVNTSGSFAELMMKTTFEKGTGEENFVFRNVDGGQKLAGYHVDSAEMTLK